MIGYFLSWAIYLVAAWLLFRLYQRSLQHFLPSEWRPVIQALLAIILFTPWPIDGNTWAPAPAIIAVLFNMLEKDWIGVLKSLLPLLLLSTVTCSIGWWRNRRYN